MKIIVLGYTRNSGVSQGNQRPFDFAQVFVATKLEPVSTPNFQRNSKGFEPQTMQLDLSAVQKFSTIEKFPVELELETSVQFVRGEPQTTVVGFK